MLEMSPAFAPLLKFLKLHPYEPIPKELLKPVFECLAEACVTIKHYGRERNWFEVKTMGHHKFLTMTEERATEKAQRFLKKYGWE